MNKIKFYFVPGLIELQRMVDEATQCPELQILFDAESGAIRMILIAFEKKKPSRLTLTRPRDPENIPLECMLGIPRLCLIDFNLRNRRLAEFIRQHVQELTLASCVFRADDMHALLEGSSSITALQLMECQMIGFAKMKHALARLGIIGPGFSFDLGKPTILDCFPIENLESLEISSCGLSDEQAVPLLRQCKKLRQLTLAHNRLTDFIVQELVQHFYLERIDLSFNQLTSESIFLISEIKRLKQLNLAGNASIAEEEIAKIAPRLSFELIHAPVPAQKEEKHAASGCGHGKAVCAICKMRLEMLRSLNSIRVADAGKECE